MKIVLIIEGGWGLHPDNIGYFAREVSNNKEKIPPGTIVENSQFNWASYTACIDTRYFSKDYESQSNSHFIFCNPRSFVSAVFKRKIVES